MSDDAPATPADRPAERAGSKPRSRGGPVLDQGEIDSVTGFRAPRRTAEEGVRAILAGAAIPREPLPALTLAFQHWAGLLPASLRGLLGTEVEASLTSLRAVRYGAFVDDVILPSQLVVFQALGLDGAGLVALGPDVARLVLDTLLGAAPVSGPRRAARPFTAIETAILTRFVEVVLGDALPAFASIGLQVSFPVGRAESDPRLAAIARPGDAAHLAELTIEVDGRPAALQVLIPSATLDSVRDRLRDSLAGREAAGDESWSRHLATEVWRCGARAEAVLHETRLPLGQVLDLAVGDTLMFDMKPSDLVEVRCGGVALARGRIGRVDSRIAVQVIEPLRTSGHPASEGISS